MSSLPLQAVYSLGSVFKQLVIMLSSKGKCSKHQLLNAAQKLKRKYRPCREDVHLRVEFSPLVLRQIQVSLLTEFGALLKTLWSDVTGASTRRVKEVGKV